MKKFKIIGYIIGIIIMAVVYYIALPPINPTALGFWAYVALGLLLFIFIHVGDYEFTTVGKHMVVKKMPLTGAIPIALIAGGFLVIIVTNIILGPLFNANAWANRIKVDNADFATEIKEVDFNKIPLLDKDSSQKLGDRTMGQMSDYVSQYYVSNLYTQINYNDEIVRVTPLEYNGLIKWLINRKNGINAYITVNSVNGESKLVKMDKGMKYMPSAKFNDNLMRHVRFKYIFDIFGDPRFEIDNEGKPYWIIPTIKYVGVSSRTQVTGAIIVDPVTGEMNKYNIKDVPTWVDNVYYADLIIEQVNNWGEYQRGFWNSVFGQKGVVNTTEGYNYLALNDDIYLYTGITSVSSDESNLGFILTNMRTGETKYYDVPGAEEYSAMESAKGQVQQMNYTSTFPLLINLNGRPTYLVSLKDNAGLVKMYAFIDVQDYQKVVVTDASNGIQAAANNYLKQYGKDGKKTVGEEKEITIKSITPVVKDGNTYYYITDEKGNKYKVSINVSDELPFISANTKVKVSYNEGTISEITSITLQ